MDSKNNRKPFQLKRWMVISLIPLAYLMGYASSEDERIEKIERLQQENKQLIRQVGGLRDAHI
jgi:hypothetical protein